MSLYGMYVCLSCLWRLISVHSVHLQFSIDVYGVHAAALLLLAGHVKVRAMDNNADDDSLSARPLQGWRWLFVANDGLIKGREVLNMQPLTRV